MSAHDDHDPHGDHDGPAHGSMGQYMIGFGLSVLLTAIPFWLVMAGTLDRQTTAIIIMALAGVQMIVHLIFFLHMNTRSEGGWTFMALIFSVVLVAITMSGSMWVMYHLNHNMMPHDQMQAMGHDMGEMP